jgi:hypothetical protein
MPPKPKPHLSLLAQRGSRSQTPILVLIILLGFLLRLIGITWGLPHPSTHWHSFHPDEFQIVEPAFAISRSLGTQNGDFNPHNFIYGNLLQNLDALVLKLASWAGTTTLPEGMGTIYLWPRLVTVLFGTLTILLLYRIGKNLGHPWIGLLAAALLAFAPGHALHSSFATVDVPATFFAVLCLLQGLRTIDAPRNKHAILGGVAAGLAASAKYPSGLVLLILWLGLFLGRHKLRSYLSSALAAFLAFALTSPYVFIAFDEFSRAIQGVAANSRIGMVFLFAGMGDGWTYQCLRSLPYILGIPTFFASILSFPFLVRRFGKKTLLLLAYLGLFFFYTGLSKNLFLRYALPLAPILCLLGASFPLLGIRNRRAQIGVSFSLVGVAVFLSVLVMGFKAESDPRDQARAWFWAEVPAGTKVGVPNWPGPLEVPMALANGGEEAKAMILAEQGSGQARFELVICKDWDLKKLQREKPDYFVISEFSWRDVQRLREKKDELKLSKVPEPLRKMVTEWFQGGSRFLSSLESQYDLVKNFRNFPPSLSVLFGSRFAPHDWLYPFPEVRVFRRK